MRRGIFHEAGLFARRPVGAWSLSGAMPLAVIAAMGPIVRLPMPGIRVQLHGGQCAGTP